jgi:diacylglycerol kinase (ATP)
MRIGVLSNLQAGRNARRTVELLAALRGVPGVAHAETNRASAVPDALFELARADVELLVLHGGDGTLQHALTAILAQKAFDGRLPLLAPLRGGRTNIGALDLGVSRDPVRAVTALLRAHWAGRLHEHIVERRVLRIELRGSKQREVRHGMFLGAGALHRATERVQRRFPPDPSRGGLGAALVAGGLLARLALPGGARGRILAPDKIEILVDGSPVERGESRLVMATTLERRFLGLRPFWGQGPGGVRLTAISAGARHLAPALPLVLAGRPPRWATEERGYVSRNARHVALRASCGLSIDGELIAPEAGRIACVSADERVRFVRA